MSDTAADLDRLARACAARLPDAPSTFDDHEAALDTRLDDLLDVVKQADARFAFDREGRPAAVAAVRAALPAMEAELFDAVVEDLTCERRAWQEALLRLVFAARAGR